MNIVLAALALTFLAVGFGLTGVNVRRLRAMQPELDALCERSKQRGFELVEVYANAGSLDPIDAQWLALSTAADQAKEREAEGRYVDECRRERVASRRRRHASYVLCALAPILMTIACIMNL